MDKQLEEFVNRWQTETNVGSIEDRIKRNEGWNLFFSTMAKERTGVFSIEEKEAIDFVKSEGNLEGVNSILDVGCGTGRYTLPLSTYASRVLGVDMSDDSLNILNRDAKNNGITNIETKSSMWEYFDTTEKFDLAFSAMCPAICSKADVDKLESFATKYCAIVTSAKGTYSTNRRNLQKIIAPDGLQNAVKSDAIYIYNYLYLQDKKPSMKVLTNRRVEVRDIDKAIVQLQQNFAIYGYTGKEVDKIITDYVYEHAVDGKLEEVRILNRAVITWKVK